MIVELDLQELVKSGLTVPEFLSDKYPELNVRKYFPSYRKAKISSERKEKLFKELYQTYPTMVITSRGERRSLKSGTAKARLKYFSIIGDDIERHNHIIECLKAEIANREALNSLGYMVLLSTWLNNEGWSEGELILESGEEIKTVTKSDYGMTIV